MKTERKIKIAAVISAALGIMAGLSEHVGIYLRIMWAPVILLMVALWLVTFFAPYISAEKKKTIQAKGMAGLIVLVLAPVSAMFAWFFSAAVLLLAKALDSGIVSGELALYGVISIILVLIGMYMPTTVSSFIEEFAPEKGGI